MLHGIENELIAPVISTWPYHRRWKQFESGAAILIIFMDQPLLYIKIILKFTVKITGDVVLSADNEIIHLNFISTYNSVWKSLLASFMCVCVAEVQTRIFKALVSSTKVFFSSAKRVHLQCQKCSLPAQKALVATNECYCLPSACYVACTLRTLLKRISRGQCATPDYCDVTNFIVWSVRVMNYSFFWWKKWSGHGRASRYSFNPYWYASSATGNVTRGQCRIFQRGLNGIVSGFCLSLSVHK